MLEVFIDALAYAAQGHVSQRRKGCDDIPYINHPIKVVELLQKVGDETNIDLFSAALLHDILEDTSATEQEMRDKFGDSITNIVVEVTDDMSLSYDDRKKAQIRKAPHLTPDAKKIKIADKISNINDMLTLPINWSNHRKRQYVEWSIKVVAGCRNINPLLDKAFDEVCGKAEKILLDE